MKKIVLFLFCIVFLSSCGTGNPSYDPKNEYSDSSEESVATPSPTEDPREEITEEILQQKLFHFVYQEDEFDKHRLYASKFDHAINKSGLLVPTESEDVFDPFQAFIRTEGTEYTLVFTFHYFGDSWIFFDAVDFSINDEIHSFDLSSYNSDQNVTSGGSVSEYISIVPGSDMLDALSEVSSSSTCIVKIRLRGKKSYVSTFSMNKKSAILETIAVYNDLKTNYK